MDILVLNEDTDTGRKSLYRPPTFSEYIGQTNAKELLTAVIQATKTRGSYFPHTLVSGQAGTGKTTLAKIVAHELGVPFTELITSTVDTSFDLLARINETNGGVLFLDEIHGLSRPMAESIYSIMEDFCYNGLNIKPFTMIGATTELGELIKNRRPLVDRFKIKIELDEYTLNELAVIIQHYKSQMFPKDIINGGLFYDIAKNARGNPRLAIGLLENTIYVGDLTKTLKYFKLIKDGYTLRDLKTLKYISLNEKGVGLQGLTSYLGTSAENYMQDIEPWLLRNNLIVRTPRGRKITPEGQQKIIELEQNQE
jgi:Holliday junction DNA helicase RuvB